MRTATALRPREPRAGRAWYLGAVLSAVLAVGLCLLGWRQADQADRIAANPVRVEGVITRLPAGSGTYSQVSYGADGRQHTAADLWLPEGAKLGDPICLEHAADDPVAVRVCGLHYPQPVGIGLARISVPVAVVLFGICVFRIRRQRHSRAVWTEQVRASAQVALASEAMPAISQGRRSRRRRRGAHR